MATTRIMPLHVGKGRTESRAISDIIDYVANPQKTDHGRLITGYECDSRVADAEFMLAKRQYIAATGRVRGADDVIAYHVRQSFCPGEITPEEANRLGVEFAKRFTKEKHAFIVCTHISVSRFSTSFKLSAACSLATATSAIFTVNSAYCSILCSVKKFMVFAACFRLWIFAHCSFNYDNLIAAIHILRDRNGLNFPTDGITVSTVGPVNQLKKLREEHLKIQLTISEPV